MTLRVGWESIAALSAEWGLLESVSVTRSLFLSLPWQQAWAISCRGSTEGHKVLTVRRQADGVLCGIVPLDANNHQATFSLDSNVTDYQDVLTVPGEERPVWEAALTFAESEGWKRIELTGIREDSPSMAILPQLAEAKGWHIERTMWDRDPYITLPTTWEDYVQSLGKKDRHELRRKFRRLEASGQVSYKVYDRWSDEVPAALDLFIDLMGQSRDEKAEFLTEERRGFLRTLTQTMAEAGALRLCFLELDGVRVSATMSFQDDGRLLLYNSGYDTAYRSLSVGLLLKAWGIRYAIENGLREFDFLRGDESYKYDLGGVDRSLYRFVLER
jgi:CelD/BcsL family acetyltransferase involved in cellulose biosynthesis